MTDGNNLKSRVPKEGKYINIIKNRGKRHDRKGKGLIELGTEPPRIKLYWVSPRTATYHFCCAQSRKSWDDFTSHDNAYLTRAHIECFSRLEVNLFHRNLNGHFSDGQICENEIIWRLNLVPRSFSDEAWGDRSGTRLLKYLKDDKKRFHSRGQRLRKFTGAKESVYIIKEFMINSSRIDLKHQHGRYFVVLEHHFGRRDVMWKRFIRP